MVKLKLQKKIASGEHLLKAMEIWHGVECQSLEGFCPRSSNEEETCILMEMLVLCNGGEVHISLPNMEPYLLNGT